jgi:hypothetical protein
MRKTYSLRESTYWWSGIMNHEAKEEVAACTVCDRVKTSFGVKDPKPLPMMGLNIFHRWGCDLCKLPIEFDCGKRYVMVIIEHFSKWIELVLRLLAKESQYTVAALRNVLNQFGASAEVVFTKVLSSKVLSSTFWNSHD